MYGISAKFDRFRVREFMAKLERDRKATARFAAERARVAIAANIQAGRAPDGTQQTVDLDESTKTQKIKAGQNPPLHLVGTKGAQRSYADPTQWRIVEFKGGFLVMVPKSRENITRILEARGFKIVKAPIKFLAQDSLEELNRRVNGYTVEQTLIKKA